MILPTRKRSLTILLHGMNSLDEANPLPCSHGRKRPCYSYKDG